ncbi:MAG: hypothetical protein LBB49_02260, partial [Gracilibacteraceae bacterium]|nr:hypothetical protein [Gracilibacteraceae bacterium]
QVLAAVCRERGAPLICAGLAEGAGRPTGGSEWVEAKVGLPAGEAGPSGVESWPSADGWAYAVPLPALSPEGAEHSVRFDYYGLDANLSGCEVTLAGRHQVLNAATALAAVEVFLQRERGSVSQWSGINLMALSSCQLSIDVKWPGRLELIRCTYLDKTVRVLLDGAHNEDGVRVLREALVQGYPRRRLVICFAMLADKAVEASLGVLMPLGDAFVMTRPPSSRAGDWKKLASMVRGAGYLCVEEENIESAMRRAMSLCGEEDLLCVTGSLYMLAQARSYALSCVV